MAVSTLSSSCRLIKFPTDSFHWVVQQEDGTLMKEAGWKWKLVGNQVLTQDSVSLAPGCVGLTDIRSGYIKKVNWCVFLYVAWWSWNVGRWMIQESGSHPHSTVIHHINLHIPPLLLFYHLYICARCSCLSSGERQNLCVSRGEDCGIRVGREIFIIITTRYRL